MARKEYEDFFQGLRGFTQGEPLPPQIFNVVVDMIVRQWVGIVVENEAVPDGFGHMVVDKQEFLYADDGLIVSTNPLCM